MSKATLYINNLNEKPSINTTKKELQSRLEKYGEILSLILKKKVSLKGQAFVTFKNPASSSKAQKELNGSQLLGKVISVSFANENSVAYHKATLSGEEFTRFLETRSKKRKLESEEAASAPAKRKRIKLIKSDKPNNVLLLQNLSSSVTKDELVEFFSKFKGFIDARLIKVRKLSFIEFSDIADATKVIAVYSDGNIQDFKNDEDEPSFITFAK